MFSNTNPSTPLAPTVPAYFIRSSVLDSPVELWAQFCDDTNCTVNCGESLQVSNSACAGESGRNSILFHHSILGIDGGNGDGSAFSLVTSLSKNCPCQSACGNYTDTGSTYCIDISAFNASQSVRFISGTCAADTCSNSTQTSSDGSQPSTTTSNPATTSPAPSSHAEDNRNTKIAIAIPTTVVGIGIALALLYCWYKRRAPRRNREIVDLVGSDLGHEVASSQVPTIEPYTTPPTMNERNRLTHAKHMQNGGLRDSGRGPQNVSPAPEERFQRLEELLRSTSRPQSQDHPGDTNTAALRDEHPPAYPYLRSLAQAQTPSRDS